MIGDISGAEQLPSSFISIILHPTRNGDAAADFFKNNPDGSYIMADGYAGYNKLKDFNRCCCYAHIRRYFIEAIPKGHEKDFTNPVVQGML